MLLELLGCFVCLSGAVTLRGANQDKLGFPALPGFVYNRSEISIMIPETRPVVTLPVVALQAHSHFPELQIQIMYGADNKDFVHTQKTLLELRQKGALLLTPMPGDAYHVHSLPDLDSRKTAYSRALESPEFWEQVTTPKVLLAQTDSWLCNGARQHLKDFLQYEYVGAPWSEHEEPRCPKIVGNGGFSLRDREAMLRITRTFPDNEGLPEDIYFCKHLADSDKLAPAEVAASFSREQSTASEKVSGPATHSLGVHQVSTGWTLEQIHEYFESECPGVHLTVSLPSLEVLDRDGTLSEARVQQWKNEFLPKMVA